MPAKMILSLISNVTLPKDTLLAYLALFFKMKVAGRCFLKEHILLHIAIISYK